MILSFRVFCLLFCSLLTAPLFASTWYVRPDGGTRFSSKMTSGQCDGTADAPYPGSGTNRHCAFNDVRFLFQDGSYADMKSFPGWGWIGKGGDTYLLRGSIGQGVSYRVGWNNPKSTYDEAKKTFYGVAGDPYVSGMPPPPSGTAAEHTRILGENYASCSAASAKTQIHGGYGVTGVLNMSGSSYVDLACLDITDFSGCALVGGATQPCNKNPGTMSDFAKIGILWNNQATHDTLTNVHIHGLAGEGMNGPTGDGTVFKYLDIIGNSGAGWNADNGSVGAGSLLVQNFDISWNGCTEEYPLVHPLPYAQCADDSSGGYGDGFGTASLDNKVPWNVHFDQGTVSYNTQDGLDALHISGPGSSMTINHVLAFGNMGQQVKIGGSAGILTDNQIVTNCNAMRQDIPGTPHGYNTHLSDFCRAADAGIVITVNDDAPSVFVGNTIYSASATGVEVECANNACGTHARIDFRNNIFVGFKNDAAHGYQGGGRGEYSNPIYIGPEVNPFTNAGSTYSGNTTFHGLSTWKCPAKGEKDAHCGDPHLLDETWHNYGHGDMSPAKGGVASISEKYEPETVLSAVSKVPALALHVRLRTVACLCAGALGVAAWQGLRSRQDR